MSETNCGTVTDEQGAFTLSAGDNATNKLTVIEAVI